MKLGTNYGGWDLPDDVRLDSQSIVYSGGVGEDISFDLLLQDKYDCQIFLIDPTKKAITHFDEIKKAYASQQFLFSGSIQPDYLPIIQPLRPNFDKFTYLPLGIWHKKDVLSFYRQDNHEYVSQSIIPGMFGATYDTVPVLSIKEFMTKLGHSHIDLLKLDIEGAEVQSLQQMIIDKIYPTYLCIEFDLLLKNKDPEDETRQIIQRLLHVGYQIVVNNNLNITFQLIK